MNEIEEPDNEWRQKTPISKHGCEYDGCRPEPDSFCGSLPVGDLQMPFLKMLILCDNDELTSEFLTPYVYPDPGLVPSPSTSLLCSSYSFLPQATSLNFSFFPRGWRRGTSATATSLPVGIPYIVWVVIRVREKTSALQCRSFV